MPPEDIDDLFRAKLDGHATPPGEALWARLQADADADANAEPVAHHPAAADERLDQLFQQGLSRHATPPGRALWERLEDEHLRPRKRRPAAWWPMALAAAVALLLVAGGAGLWLGFPGSKTQTGTVASFPNHRQKAGLNAQKKALSSKDSDAAQVARAAAAPGAAPDSRTVAAHAANETSATSRQKQFSASQATRPAARASTAPKASMAALGQSARHSLGTNRQPDTAADHRPLVARTTARSATRPALNPPLPPVADEPRPTINPNAAVALAPKSAPEIVLATSVPVPDLANRTGELITVDVRSGAASATRPAKSFSTALAEAEAPGERRGLGGRLLQQAGHLVRGERVNLAEATGLPETVTLRATIAGRSITKSIQL